MNIKTRYVQAKLKESDELATTVMDEMLCSGVTFWESPDWVQSLPFRLTGWAHDGHLIRLRLVSEWLLSTVPIHAHSELLEMLCSFTDGEIAEAYPNAACRWPASSGFYARRLDLGMAAIAFDWEAMASVNVQIALRTGKPIEVPVAMV